MGGPNRPAASHPLRSTTTTRGLPAAVDTAATAGLSTIVANGRQLLRYFVVAVLLASR
jgi:hypothetical protein